MSRYGGCTAGLAGWSKDPDEVLDYAIDWKSRLAGDAIVSSTWIVPDGLTQDQASVSGSRTTIWLSGGVVNQVYNVLNRITTVGGRTMDQTVPLTVKSK